MNKSIYSQRWYFLAAFSLLWIVISILRSPSLDSYGDMIENYAWGQTWEWGSFKHPPFFAWVVKIWFLVMPEAVWSYYLLSYLNASIGILGIVALANWWLPEGLESRQRQAVLGVVLITAALGFPYSNLASKFNADTVLLSLWPWTAYAFFRSLHKPQGLRYAVLLGVLAAMAMLAKYYSGVLLLGLFIISLITPSFHRWYASPRPYVALLVMLALLAPHVLWEIRVDFPFRHYLDGKLQTSVQIGRMAVFVFSGIFYWLLAWLAWLAWRWQLRQQPQTAVAWRYPAPVLYALILLPALITLTAHLLTGIHVTTHWAIPVWYALPVLLGLSLGPRLAQGLPQAGTYQALAALAVLLLLGGALYAGLQAYKGKNSYYYARPDMVQAINTAFARQFPGQRIAWAGGNWPESAALAFFDPAHPRALPGVPDERPALVNPHPSWRAEHGVIVCQPGGYGQVGLRDSACEEKAAQWLRAQGLPDTAQVLPYQAQGWQYPRPVPKNVVVFWVPPLQTP